MRRFTGNRAGDHLLDGELVLDAARRVTALRVYSTTNLGAHFTPTIPYSTVSNMERIISSLYAIPAIHLHIEGRFTNTAPNNVWRGIGRLECVYTVERLMERAAHDTGGDPVALRRINMVLAAAFPCRTATGALYDASDFVARLEEAVKIADVIGFAARRAATEKEGRLRGLGFGPYLEGTGGSPEELAEVRVYPDGRVEVPVGGQS
ncbi:MAG: molybdopterin cofactor-binding domain-containing protein [Burkholderiales bacterium]